MSADRSIVIDCNGDLTYSSTGARARDGPTGLGDPDPLAGGDLVDGVAGCVDGLPEDIGGVADGGVLKVRVSIGSVRE